MMVLAGSGVITRVSYTAMKPPQWGKAPAVCACCLAETERFKQVTRETTFTWRSDGGFLSRTHTTSRETSIPIAVCGACEAHTRILTSRYKAVAWAGGLLAGSAALGVLAVWFESGMRSGVRIPVVLGLMGCAPILGRMYASTAWRLMVPGDLSEDHTSREWGVRLPSHRWVDFDNPDYARLRIEGLDQEGLEIQEIKKSALQSPSARVLERALTSESSGAFVLVFALCFLLCGLLWAGVTQAAPVRVPLPGA